MTSLSYTRLLCESSCRIKLHSTPGGDPAHQSVTSRDSPTVIGKQDQPSDCKFNKIT